MQISEFQAILVYKVSSRTTRKTQRNPVSKLYILYIQQKPRIICIIRIQFSDHSKSWIHHHTGKKQDYDLKSLPIMVIEDFEKGINNSLKEIEENRNKQLEALKEETKKFLKELQENTIKQEKEISKSIQDLKMEIETVKKSQREIALELENLGKRSGVIDASITNRIQEIEEKISGTEDIIANIDTTVKEKQNAKRS